MTTVTPTPSPTSSALHAGNPWRRASLRSVFARSVNERMRFTLLVGAALALMAMLMGPMFNSLEASLADLDKALPDSITSLTGGDSLADPIGWMNAEMFSLMVPGGLLAVAIVVGSRALAGEEEDGTLATLLANPVSRTTVLFEKAAALVVLLLVVSIFTFLGTWAGSLAGGLGLDVVDILAITVHAMFLGIAFGFLTMALGALTGARRRTLAVAAGVAGVSFIIATQLPQADNLAGLAKISPWYWYNGTNPLANGFAPGHLLLLVAFACAALGTAQALFDRRDLDV